MKIALGIDIGGTNTCIGSVSPDGSIIARNQFATSDFEKGPLYADRLAQEIKSIITQTEKHIGSAQCQWIGLGIGAPNGNVYTGSIDFPPNLKFKGITPLVDLLKQRLPQITQCRLTNDANAAALGEKIFGAAKDYSDFIMITLGTGLGSGIFVNNQLVYGHDGFAGEVGHISIVPEGRYCGFGRRGSLENYCSATGIRRTFFEMIAQYGGPTSLDNLTLGNISSKNIAEAAYAHDRIAVATFEFTGRLLGEALASVALVTSPKAFFLFGGPVQAGKILLDPLKKSFEDHLIPPYKNKIKIIESTLPLGDAAILGAAALVS